MERKISETFEYKGKTFKVSESKRGVCIGCFFNGRCFSPDVTGDCISEFRSDKKDVIFVEVQEQPQQAEQPKLNLCEILKGCPMYELFWSPMLGDVNFHHIDHEAKRILITLKTGAQWNINSDATITFANVTSPEIMLYPSKEQRDWSKFTAPWLKKERFGPNTLQPFDRVLVRDSRDFSWNINIYSNKYNNKSHPYQCITSVYRYCIPYNDETKHLVGTTDEAPDLYRYWEDYNDTRI